MVIEDELLVAYSASRSIFRVGAEGSLSFGLDCLLQRDNSFHAAFGPERIVAAEHPFGANTTISTGAQMIRDKKPLGVRDPRFTASIVISAPLFYGETDLAAVLASDQPPRGGPGGMLVNRRPFHHG